MKTLRILLSTSALLASATLSLAAKGYTESSLPRPGFSAAHDGGPPASDHRAYFDPAKGTHTSNPRDGQLETGLSPDHHPTGDRNNDPNDGYSRDSYSRSGHGSGYEGGAGGKFAVSFTGPGSKNGGSAVQSLEKQVYNLEAIDNADTKALEQVVVLSTEAEQDDKAVAGDLGSGDKILTNTPVAAPKDSMIKAKAVQAAAVPATGNTTVIPTLKGAAIDSAESAAIAKTALQSRGSSGNKG